MAQRGEVKIGGARGRGGPDVLVRRVPHVVRLAGANPQASSNFGIFFTADDAYEVVGVTERHETAGSDAGAVTIDVTKVPSGTAKSGGASVLAAPINAKSTADTNQSPALHATQSRIRLAAGDSLALVPTGTLTALAGVTVTVYLKRV